MLLVLVGAARIRTEACTPSLGIYVHGPSGMRRRDPMQKHWRKRSFGSIILIISTAPSIQQEQLIMPVDLEGVAFGLSRVVDGFEEEALGELLKADVQSLLAEISDVA